MSFIMTMKIVWHLLRSESCPELKEKSRSLIGMVLSFSSFSAEEQYFMVEVGIFDEIPLKTSDTQKKNENINC